MSSDALTIALIAVSLMLLLDSCTRSHGYEEEYAVPYYGSMPIDA